MKEIEATNVRTITKIRLVQSNEILNYLFYKMLQAKIIYEKNSLAFCTGYFRRTECCGGCLGLREMRKQGSG